jgi:hypothetical protein
MSSATNPVSFIDLTPSEAFLQTDPYSLSSSSTNGWKRWKKGWKKERTPAEIARIEEMREAEDYVMRCLTPGCKMYNTFDKCDHNIIRMPQMMGPIVFSKP